jgi:hypothetical protein
VKTCSHNILPDIVIRVITVFILIKYQILFDEDISNERKILLLTDVRICFQTDMKEEVFWKLPQVICFHECNNSDACEINIIILFQDNFFTSAGKWPWSSNLP